jgi:outer membrane protein OmpU
MNKLTKVGLTALTTTLVASSAYAADLSVTGSASIAYTGLDNTDNTSPYSMGDSINFVGSGELDNGMTVTFSYELDNGATDDMGITIGLADGLGTVKFSGNSVRAGGAGTVQDIIPTAYTPVYENANETAGAVDNGLAVSTSGENQTGMWGYANSVAGLDFSIGFNPTNSTTTADLNPGSETSIGLSYNAPVEGLRVVAGFMSDDNISDNSTYGVSYSYGPVVVAYQKTEVDYDSAQGSADQDAEHMGISFAVNENLTISGGIQEVDITGSTLNEENSGIAVSYTMGSITLSAQRNKLENGSGTAANDVTVNTINLSFAF